MRPGYASVGTDPVDTGNRKDPLGPVLLIISYIREYNNSSRDGSSTPPTKTGDETNIPAFAIVGGLAVVAFILLLVTRKKKDDDDGDES